MSFWLLCLVCFTAHRDANQREFLGQDLIEGGKDATLLIVLLVLGMYTYTETLNSILQIFAMCCTTMKLL